MNRREAILAALAVVATVSRQDAKASSNITMSQKHVIDLQPGMVIYLPPGWSLNCVQLASKE